MFPLWSFHAIFRSYQYLDCHYHCHIFSKFQKVPSYCICIIRECTTLWFTTNSLFYSWHGSNKNLIQVMYILVIWVYHENTLHYLHQHITHQQSLWNFNTNYWIILTMAYNMAVLYVNQCTCHYLEGCDRFNYYWWHCQGPLYLRSISRSTLPLPTSNKAFSVSFWMNKFVRSKSEVIIILTSTFNEMLQRHR